jgi:hypothetical protein
MRKLVFNQKKKTKEENVKKLEKFFVCHQSQFLFLLISFVSLTFLSELSYLNLFLVRSFIFFLLWLFSIFLFKLSGRFSVKLALFLLCLGSLLSIIKREKLAEGMGNLIYEILLIGVIQEIAGYFKEVRGRHKKLLR